MYQTHIDKKLELLAQLPLDDRIVALRQMCESYDYVPPIGANAIYVLASDLPAEEERKLYVGITNRPSERFRQHHIGVKDFSKSVNLHKSRYLAKHGFNPMIFGYVMDREDANKIEKKLIELLGGWRSQYVTNLTDGGEGTVGRSGSVHGKSVWVPNRLEWSEY